MHRRLQWGALIIVLAVAGGLSTWTAGPHAVPSFFDSRCSTCHNDDSATCAGCHRHNGTLEAAADQAEYYPGDPVTITLDSSGAGSGWVRGRLYDHTGALVAELGGPTLTGDDGLGDPVTFPIDLETTAPPEAGDYVFEAAWFGSNDAGTGHVEDRVPVTVHVVDNVDVGDDWGPGMVAEGLRLRVTPNPMQAATTVRFYVPAGHSAAQLRIVDTSGRLVRELGSAQASDAVQALRWDGTDEAGRPVATGAYLAILSGGGQQTMQRVLVLR